MSEKQGTWDQQEQPPPGCPPSYDFAITQPQAHVQAPPYPMYPLQQPPLDQQQQPPYPPQQPPYPTSPSSPAAPVEPPSNHSVYTIPDTTNNVAGANYPRQPAGLAEASYPRQPLDSLQTGPPPPPPGPIVVSPPASTKKGTCYKVSLGTCVVLGIGYLILKFVVRLL